MNQRLTLLLSKFRRDKKRKKTYSDLEKELNYKNKRTDSQWRQVFLGLRIVWAIIPLFLLAAACWFTYWLTAGIGNGTLSFKGYETFLNIVAGDLIVNVLGIVYIVMKFLFPAKNSDSTEKAKEDESLFDLPSSHQ